ncbi:unnamed protein product, partial [Staurois parvus]
TRYRAHGKHTPRPRSQAWSFPTPPAISPRCWLTTGVSFWLLRAPAESHDMEGFGTPESHDMEGIGTPESHDMEGIGTPESHDMEGIGTPESHGMEGIGNT